MSWSLYLPDDRTRWTEGYYSHPIWASEPELNNIKDIVASLVLPEHTETFDRDGLKVEFLAEGAYHRIYQVNHPSLPTPYLFRVAVPVDPKYKMESEMATLVFLRQRTTIPVARPIAWDSSADNSLGYEWCLVEKLPGVELRGVWRKMPWEKKLDLVDDLAVIMAQLWSSKIKFCEIGSLYMMESSGGKMLSLDLPSVALHVMTEEEIKDCKFEIRQSVNGAFFAGRRCYLSSDRGPYLSCHDWIKAQIEIEKELIRTAKVLLTSKDEMTAAQRAEDWSNLVGEGLGVDKDSFLDEYDNMMETCEAYLRLLPDLFPIRQTPDHEPRFSLCHSDLREANILVDPDTFSITGIIDWEQTCTVPDWYGRDYPMFINDDEPFDDEEPRIPETYDSDDENCNHAVIANRDRWDAKLLRKRFDEKLTAIGWKNWRAKSSIDATKSQFFQGAAELNDSWIRARNQLKYVESSLQSVSVLEKDGKQDERGDAYQDETEEKPESQQSWWSWWWFIWRGASVCDGKKTVITENGMEKFQKASTLFKQSHTAAK